MNIVAAFGHRLSTVWWVFLGGALLGGCVFDTMSLDSLQCDPSDPYSCAEGLCTVEGYCVINPDPSRVDFGDVVEPDSGGNDAIGDATDMEEVEPIPCGGCAPGEECCGESCVQVVADPLNCGGCGVECGENAACSGGACTCDVGRSDCDPIVAGCETDVLRSEEFCGSCDPSSACAENFMCDGGLCLCGGAACGTGESCCSGGAALACVDMETSLVHCGACGNACGQGEVCDAGVCVCKDDQTGASSPECTDGVEVCCKGTCIDPGVQTCDCGGAICDFVCCGGTTCADVATDVANCGACGTACAANEVCDAGTCACQAGFTRCDGVCVDLMVTAQSCGACDRDCTLHDNVTGASCVGGACAYTCTGGFADCSGATGCETQTDANPLSCGGCPGAGGVDCNQGANVGAGACMSGTCSVTTCSGFYADCNGDWNDGCERPVDTTTDCGSCGNDCAAEFAGLNVTGIACTDAGNSVCEYGGCASGYLDCDGDPGNGCERPGTSCRVTSDLIALYLFEEGTGSTTADMSGFGGPLTLTEFKETDATDWLSGRDGVLFDGGNGGMAADDSQSDRIRDECAATDEVTVEAWIKPSNTTQSGPSRIVSYSYSTSYRNFTLGQSGSRYSVRLRTDSGSITSNGQYDGNDNDLIVTGSGSLTTNVQHVVMTFDAGSDDLILYVDGAEVARATIAGNLDNWSGSHRLGIANEVSSADRRWAGEMYLVAIYRRALTPAEVQQNYAAGDDP